MFFRIAKKLFEGYGEILNFKEVTPFVHSSTVVFIVWGLISSFSPV
jgi:hypothetical protein